MEDRNENIIKDTLAGVSQSYLMVKYNVTYSMLRKIQKEKGIILDNSKEKNAISEQHKELGLKLNFFMMERELKVQDFAALLGVSFRRLSGILKGHTDITLSELIKITKLLNISYDDLLRKKKDGKLSIKTVPDDPVGVSH